MMKIVLESFSSNKLVELESHANDRISIRGNHTKYDLPAAYKDPRFFIPFNEIPIKYCPTDRYSYLNKYVKTATKILTWESLTGKILDDAYAYFIKHLKKYCQTSSHKCMDISKDFQTSNENFMKAQDDLIASELENLLNPPSDKEIIKFQLLIEKVLRYETQLASTLTDYQISMNQDIEIDSIGLLLFPFVTKPTYTVMGFGITNKAQPDFLFDNRVVIDVKSSPWRDEFYITLAGYALALEKATGRPVNLGVIVMPDLHDNRNVPFYFRSEIIPIEDKYRKAFLLRRENLLELMKNRIDPGLPVDNTPCKTCRYFMHCFPQP